MHPDIVSGYWTLGGLVQNVCLWGIEMGTTNYVPPDNDVMVQSIVEPVSGVELTSAEPITIKIKNVGLNDQTDIPYEVTWDGGNYSGTLAGTLASGESTEVTLPVTADLSAYGDYNFEACTQLAGDENPDNDCKTKVVTNIEPFVCVDGLYSTGCSFGDGLTYWDFSDVNVPDIPCGNGNPYDWYHDYTDMVHSLEAGMDYTLTVQAGYNNTFFDVWIDFNDNLYYDPDELILNDVECAEAGVNYEFTVTIPATAANGTHLLRYRTNWQATVEDPCETYSYGNACDFSAQIGGSGGSWLSADPVSGTLNQNESMTITVTYNSDGLEQGDYNGDLTFTSNDPNNPTVVVPVLLHVGGGCPYPPPTDLMGEEISPNTVYLQWQAPETPGGVIRWDDGINADGIGLTNGGSFYVAARWDASQLTQYDGLYLTHVDIFPRSESGSATFTLKVWTGANAGNLIHSQDLTGLTFEEWNTIELDAAVQIDASTELWIGYETEHPAGDFPAGCDAGPAVAGYGDMITLDGSSWESMSNAYGLDYNWNIAGIIGIAADGLPLAQPIVMNDNISNPSADLAQGFLPKAANPEWVEALRDYLYFNVYRDGAMIADNIMDTEYTDNGVPNGDHEYQVSAVYETCESFSDPITVGVTSINEAQEPLTTAMYPNPANEVVNIESNMNITHVMIMNNLGQVVYNDVANGKLVQINTSSFEKGIYFVQFETSAGKTVEKLIVQ
jgi:hypothetical protein